MVAAVRGKRFELHRVFGQISVGQRKICHVRDVYTVPHPLKLRLAFYQIGKRAFQHGKDRAFPVRHGVLIEHSHALAL